jgi:hypothetical protein
MASTPGIGVPPVGEVSKRSDLGVDRSASRARLPQSAAILVVADSLVPMVGRLFVRMRWRRAIYVILCAAAFTLAARKTEIVLMTGLDEADGHLTPLARLPGVMA